MLENVESLHQLEQPCNWNTVAVVRQKVNAQVFAASFFVPVFLQTLRPKYRMLPSCRFFLLDILKLKIVNC